MTTLAQTYLSLADLYKRSEDDYGQQMATIIEVLSETKPAFMDMYATECNLGTLHRHTIRTGLPSGAWGALYQGIPQSKSTTQQVDDTTGFYEQLSTVDTRLLELAPNRDALRLSEAVPHLEAMGQEIETGIFYHNTATTPEKFKGLAARYNTIGGSGAGNQVVSAAGNSNGNTSIWFVTWGPNDTCTLYPKGTKAGIQREDMGKQRVLDGSSNPYYVEEELFRIHIGLAVKDWRNNARICNIDVSDMQAGSVDLYKYMRKAYYKLHKRRIGKVDNQQSVGRTVIYCNRDVLEALEAQQMNSHGSDTYVRLRPMELDGQEVMSYRGIPIRETDALLNTEADVS